MDAIVFDLDGLLVDTEAVEFATWQAEFRAHGVDLALGEWIQCVGAGPGEWDVLGHLTALLGRPLDRSAVLASRWERYAELEPSIPARPGMPELVTESVAAGLRLAVASSSPRAWVEGHLTRLGLRPAFVAVRTLDDVTRAKPAPDLFLAACSALGVAPARAVALEDSPNGVRAARAAGLFTVAVPNDVTAGFDLSEANVRLDDPRAATLTRLRAEFARATVV